MSHEPPDPFDKSDIIAAKDAEIATLRQRVEEMEAAHDTLRVQVPRFRERVEAAESRSAEARRALEKACGWMEAFAGSCPGCEESGYSEHAGVCAYTKSEREAMAEYHDSPAPDSSRGEAKP